MTAFDVEPPWLFHPAEERGSIQWRMGMGEEMYEKFYIFFSQLSGDERRVYAAAFPEPKNWEGIYDMISDHPWYSD